MSMRGFFDEIYSDMSRVFTEVFGDEYEIRTERHGTLMVEAVYKNDFVETMIGGHGASQRMPYAHIDFRRDQLVAAGMTDLEADLHGAQVVIDGRLWNVSEPEDDMRAMVKCRVSKTSAPAT